VTLTACNAVPQAPALQNPKLLAPSQDTPNPPTGLPSLAALLNTSVVQQFYQGQLFPAPQQPIPAPLAPTNLSVGAYFQGLTAAARM